MAARPEICRDFLLSDYFAGENFKGEKCFDSPLPFWACRGAEHKRGIMS